MRRSPPLTIIAVSSAALILLGGCGGDAKRGEGDTGGTSAQTSSNQTPAATAPAAPAVVSPVTDPARRAYIARVDRVCRSLDPDRNAALERVGASADAQEAAKAYEGGIATGETELQRIEAIPPPPGEGRLIRTNIYQVVRRQLTLRRQIGNALAAVDVARLRNLRRELDDLTRALTGFARGYGFRVCGED